MNHSYHRGSLYVPAWRTRSAAKMANDDFITMLKGFSLTTAEILYRMPDHPSLLQSYIWQDYDLHPRFPKLLSFLEFWSRNLDGQLFRVRVAHKELVRPSEFTFLDGKFLLN